MVKKRKKKTVLDTLLTYLFLFRIHDRGHVFLWTNVFVVSVSRLTVLKEIIQKI